MKELREITITPINEVFTKNELRAIKAALGSNKVETHQCHYNSGIVGLALEGLGYNARICQGDLVCTSGTGIYAGHSWNAVIRNGVKYYVDFTREWANKESAEGTHFGLYLEKKVKDITNVFDNEGYAFILPAYNYDEEGEYGYWYDENLEKHITHNGYMEYAKAMGIEINVA